MFGLSVLLIFILTTIIAFVLHFLKKPLKVIGIVYLCAFLLIGYNSFIRFTPIYIANSKNLSQNELCQKLVKNYLQYKKFAWSDRITDYKVDSAKIDTIYEDGRYIIFSSFNVKPLFHDKDNRWSEGNGIPGENGWIKDICIFFDFGKVGNLYLTYSDWNTGP
jgi:apolipoprotein N-acyltransferase